MAKVNTHLLSIGALIFIVDELRRKQLIPDRFIADVYLRQLEAQITAINLQLSTIDNYLKTVKLSKTNCKVITEKRYRLAGARDMKIELIKALAKGTRESKS